MPNRFYPKGAEKILSAQIDLSADTIKVVLVTNAYTFSAAHEFLNQLTTVGAAQTLAGKSVAGGVFDGDDAAFGAIPSGSTVQALAFYKDTGNPSTSPLLFYLDEVTGFPFATNGATVSIPWSDGAAKIFSLVAA